MLTMKLLNKAVAWCVLKTTDHGHFSGQSPLLHLLTILTSVSTN